MTVDITVIIKNAEYQGYVRGRVKYADGELNMTDQRIYPFFVNGQYWKDIGVYEKMIRDGCFIYNVMTKPQNNSDMPDMMARIKKVIFQLAECAEQKNGMIAHWVGGFWLCDDEIYLEEGHIYMKNKEK